MITARVIVAEIVVNFRYAVIDVKMLSYRNHSVNFANDAFHRESTNYAKGNARRAVCAPAFRKLPNMITQMLHTNTNEIMRDCARETVTPSCSSSRRCDSPH